MILIKDAAYLVRDADRIERDVDLLIDGSRIARIGRIDAADCPQGATILSGRNRAATPDWSTLIRISTNRCSKGTATISRWSSGVIA